MNPHEVGTRRQPGGIWPRGAAADYLPMWAGDGDGSFLVVS